MKDSLNEVVSVNNEKLILTQDMRFLARNNAVFVRNILLMNDPQAIAGERAKIEDSEKKYRETQARLEALETNAEGRELLKVIKEDEMLTRELWRKVIDLGVSGEKEKGAAILMKAVRSQQWSWLANLEGLVSMQKQAAVSAARKAMEGYERARTIMVVADCLAFIISAFLVILLASSIVRPLHEFTRTVDSIASGDFATRISLKRQDEIGTLGLHINNMAEHLQANEKELDQYRFHLEDLIEERTGDLNEQRKRFISVLIHDLKGPLVPIIGFSRKLMNHNHAGAEKNSEYAHAIHDASMKLAATIDQVSKDLRGGRLDHSFNTEVFDFEGLLHAVIQSFAPQAEAGRLEIVLSVSKADAANTSEGGIRYAGDPGKIRTLMENLIGNAVKYAESKICISLKKDDKFLEMIVEDDGTGIEEEYTDRIFEEYFQAPRSKDGSGVGLYSAKKIVEHYKGDIYAGVSDSGGARFTVNLPILS
jgi:signal transduction histidine kinase